MRTKKNIVHRRHSIKRNVLDKIKSRSRKNNVKFNNTSKTKLRKRHFNFNNQSGGTDKLNKFKKSNCKLSIEDISKDNCLYNLVVENIYDTVEKFLGEERDNKTRKELYNSIKESVIGVLMHFVKFRDENGNLLVTNHSELDDILDFFTIFFIVKIYLSKEENTMRLRNFLEENFLTGNYASDLEITKRELTALENMLREQAGSFMSQESVKSVVSNMSSGYGSFDGSNYDNSRASQLYGPARLYSGIDDEAEYDNTDAFIGAEPVQVSVSNPLYSAIAGKQDTYATAGLVTRSKYTQMLEESKRLVQETYASRLAFIETLKRATQPASLTTPTQNSATTSVSDVKKYEEVELSAEHLANLDRLVASQEANLKRVESMANMYVGASDSRPVSVASATNEGPSSQPEQPLVVVTTGQFVLNYEQPTQQLDYSRLGSRGARATTPATESATTPAPATATTPATESATTKPAGEYDTLSTRTIRVDRELLEAAALYESTRINIDEIETKEQGEDLIRRHLKTAKTLEQIILVRDKMKELYKKFEPSTEARFVVSDYYEVSGVVGGVTSGYYEAELVTPESSGNYEKPDDSPIQLHDQEFFRDANGYMQVAIELGGGGEAEVSALNTEVSTPPPRPPNETKPTQKTGLPKHPQFSDEDIKKAIIDNIDLDVFPSHFSAAGVYEETPNGEPLSETESVKIKREIEEFLKTLPEELTENDDFKQFKDGVIQKVTDNHHKVNDKGKILQNIITVANEFLLKFKETQTQISFAQAAAKKISPSERPSYKDLLNGYEIIVKASDKLFEFFILLKDRRIEAIRENDIGPSLFILFFMTVIHNIYVGGLRKYYRLCLLKFINEVEKDTGAIHTGGGGESSILELNLDSNVIRMLKEYLVLHGELDSDNKKLAGNFTNIIPILISRSMKGGFISPFIRNFKNAIKKSSVTSLNPSDFNLVNHIFFIRKEQRPFKYDNESPQQDESESAMTTYTFGSNLQNTFGITALGTIKTGKMLPNIKGKQTLSHKYFIEAPNNSNIKTRILGSNYTKQTIKTSENFVELLEIQLEDIKKKGIVANFHTALETSNELKVEELHSYSYRLYSEQDLEDAVPDTSLYAQTQIVSELFNALKHSVVNK